MFWGNTEGLYISLPLTEAPVLKRKKNPNI